MKERANCKILKNGKVLFLEKEKNKYELFGMIDEFGIFINIDNDIYETPYGTRSELKIPNPAMDFYIELGKLLKEIK